MILSAGFLFIINLEGRQPCSASMSWREDAICHNSLPGFAPGLMRSITLGRPETGRPRDGWLCLLLGFVLIELLGEILRAHLAGQDERQQFVEIIDHRSG